MPRILGVDLGTSNSAAAFTMKVGDAPETVMVESPEGRQTQGDVFPSYVEFGPAGEVRRVGEAARQAMEVSPRRVVWGVKRLIGRTYSEVTEEDRARFLYPIEEGENNEIVIPQGRMRYSPTDIARIILESIRMAAEDETIQSFLTGHVDGAVVTRPAYFNDAQIRATKEAARVARFQAVRIESEPEAAALAYGLGRDLDEGMVMTVDWGAGTLDVVISTLTRTAEGMERIDAANPPRGYTALGGIDMDDALLSEVIRANNLEDLGAVRKTLTHDPDQLAPERITPEQTRALRQLARLRQVVEKAKIDLSAVPLHRAFAAYRGKSLPLKMARSAADVPQGEADWIVLEEVIAGQLTRFRARVAEALAAGGLTPEDISYLLLVGGPMKMPSVRNVLAEMFRGNANVSAQLQAIADLGFPVDPMECVARGAALCAVIERPPPTLPFDYGILLGNQGEVLIRAGYQAGCEGSTKSPLTCKGSPGDSVPFSLFYREPTNEYRKYGEFSFYPVFGQDGAQFTVTLKSDEDCLVSVSLTDLFTDKPLTLSQMNRAQAGAIPKPAGFRRDGHRRDPNGPEPSPPGPLLPVSADRVAQMRGSVEGLLAKARAAAQDPRMPNEETAELQGRIEALNAALGRLPQGDAPQNLYADVGNTRTRLKERLPASALSSEIDRD